MSAPASAVPAPARAAPALRRLRLGLLPLLLPLLVGAGPAQGPDGGVPPQASAAPALRAAQGVLPGFSAATDGMGTAEWTFTAPADGWYRFSARGSGSRWAVSVADPGSDGVLSSSRWSGATAGALVHAKAGSSHAVSVGVVDGPGGAFTLEWARSPAPVRLQPAGRLVDGDRDARGAPVEMRRPGDLAFGGGRLFLASGLGLTTFERNAATGGLAAVGHVEGELAGASLAWDGGRRRVVAHHCGAWRSFPVDGGGSTELNVPGDPGGCGRLLLDAAGGLVHRVGGAGVDAFSLDGDGALRFEGTAPVPGLKGAAVGGPGRVYAAGDGGLLLIERDRQTGRFTGTPLDVDIEARALAYDAAAGRLLAAGGMDLGLFAVGEGRALERLPVPDGAGSGLDGCALAAMGPGSTFDVFCEGAALSLWPGQAAYLNALPDGGAPVGTAASPDGRHVYVSTRSGELLTFERVLPSSSDDHGDSRATATRVGIPSTTAGYLDAGDQDQFRVDLGEAGSFTAETTGSTDTYGSLQQGDRGVLLGHSDDDGEGGNFRIESGRLEAGTYYVAVEGYSLSTRGAYSLVLSEGGDVTPAAQAPSVSIDAVPAGDEGAAVRLGATLAGGTYDGTPEHAWTVTGGALDDPSSAAPEWTRPSVTSNTSHTVRLAVTARGTGTNARDGTSDAARASRSALVRDTAPQLPAADAPSVSIDGVAAGDEGTAVGLSAALSGGAYDGALEYAWTATGGALDNPSSATPTWTRPAVGADASFTVRLIVTARGTGTNARNGTSDTGSASRAAQVRDVAPALPAASVPAVSINAIADGDEGTAVALAATLTGGAYDGAPEYDWDVSGGALDDDTLATPTWTRPAVTSNANVTVSLTVTVRGAGASARNGTSDTGSADRAAQVLDSPPAATSCVDDAKWKTVADYYDHNATKSPNYGANWYRVLIAYRLEDPERSLPAWEGSTAQPTTPYTASEAATGETLWFGWTPVREVLECLEAATSLPAAAAPTVAIDAVAVGDEGTTVGLSATLTGGAYDGAVEYDWSVTGGALDDATLAAPAWTRPPVASDTDHTVSLRVTVHGAGVNAQNGSSATANASLDSQVRDATPQLLAAAAPSVSINAIADGDEGMAVTLGAALAGGAYDGAPEYDWSVTGGTLNDATLAAPTWIRPAVAADTNHTVGLTVTVHGAGTSAQNGTSATANATLETQVRNVAVQLPAAAAPSVSINAIVVGEENTTVQLGATLTGGTYDGALEHAWQVDGGTLSDPASATPTWTRPAVTSDTNHTVRLTVTARGTGAAARNGTSDTANASRDAQVRDAGGDHGDDFASAAPIGIPSTTSGSLTYRDRDYFRIDVTKAGTLIAVTTGSTDTYGTLFDGDGNQLLSNDDGGQGRNFRIVAGPLEVGTYYLEVRGYRTSTKGDYTLSVTESVRGPEFVLPAAVAPAVSIRSIGTGVESTTVQLRASLRGGTYDGTPEYAWSVDGGALSDPTSATPTWTRPSVASSTHHTVSLTVTARGTGSNALDGSSDSKTTSRSAIVRDENDKHGESRATATALSYPGTVSGYLVSEDDLDYFRFRLASAARVTIEATGSTRTAARLLNRAGDYLSKHEDGGNGASGRNFRIVADLAAGQDYYLEVRGVQWWHTSSPVKPGENIGPYVLAVKPWTNTPPSVRPQHFPSAQTATAGGAPLILARSGWFGDYPDFDAGDFSWESSSDDTTVATAAFEGPALVVYPHAVGTATVTVTVRDLHGGAGTGSFTVTVSAPPTSDPSAVFNTAGDQMTLSFTDEFEPNEKRAYQARVRWKSPRDEWNRFCVTASNTSGSKQTVSVSLDLPLSGIAEPGATYEADYRHIGNSCSGSLGGLWSRVAEATTPGTGSFDVELVFEGSPSAARRKVVEEAAAFWERIITTGVPNVDLTYNPLYCSGVHFGDPIDDVRISVSIEHSEWDVRGAAVPCGVREHSGLPVAGAIMLNTRSFPNHNADTLQRMRRTAIHEIGHVLGFNSGMFGRVKRLREASGGLWLRYGREAIAKGDTHFVGSAALAAFNAAGGSSYSGAKVPLENDRVGSNDNHWRHSVLRGELMSTWGGSALSAITVQAMADLGYQVDVSQADSYQIPGTGSGSSPSISAKRSSVDGEAVEAGCEVIDDARILRTNRGTTVLEPNVVRMRPVRVQ